MKRIFFCFIYCLFVCLQVVAQEPVKVVKVEEYTAVTLYSYKNIHFDRDSVEIHRIMYPILEKILDVMKHEYTEVLLEIEGFVDDDEFISNPSLALQRANMVRDYFTKKGIAPQRLIVKDGGQAEISDDYEKWKEEAKEIMRRVTFTMIKK